MAEAAISDTRIVYGQRCSWWGTIQQAKGRKATRPGKLGPESTIVPVCPECGQRLYEMSDELTWWATVHGYARRSGDPRYGEFVEWVRGRCHPDMDGRDGLKVARALFDGQ